MEGVKNKMYVYSNAEYKKAYVELLEILKYISKEDRNKIPNEYIEFCKKNKDENYNFLYNIDREFNEQNIRKLTKLLFANLYIRYIATNKRKNEIKKMFIYESKKEKQNNELKYSYQNLFHRKEKNKKNLIEEKSLVPVKKNIFIKILDKIKTLLKIDINL